MKNQSARQLNYLWGCCPITVLSCSHASEYRNINIRKTCRRHDNISFADFSPARRMQAPANEKIQILCALSASVVKYSLKFCVLSVSVVKNIIKLSSHFASQR